MFHARLAYIGGDSRPKSARSFQAAARSALLQPQQILWKLKGMAASIRQPAPRAASGDVADSGADDVEPLGNPTLRVACIQQMADFTDLVFSQFGPAANCGVEVCWSWDVLPVSSASNAFDDQAIDSN